MININDLTTDFSTILKNQGSKNDNQTMNYIRAIQYGKALIRDVTPANLLERPIENIQMITKINELFDMISNAQEKAFGDIIK